MTFDLDILIAPDVENAQRLLTALLEAGFGTAAMTDAGEVTAHEITVFQDRYRIDVLTRAPGVEFEACYARRVSMPHAGVDLPVLNPEDVIASKLASARAVDLEDAAILKLLRDSPES
jgi:hypothetical protein